MTGRLQSVIVRPVHHPFNGVISAPGDKSISQRLGLLLPLASGSSVLQGFLNSEDALHTLQAMGALGPRFHAHGADAPEIHIEGCSGRLISPVHPLDLGNSGTGMRLMTGLLAGTSIEACLTGDASLRSRPMGRIRDPLIQMGAEIELRGDQPGCAPVWIRGRPLRGIRYPLPMASAQVKSAVLLAGLFAEGHTTVIEPLPTRDHTERVFRALGLPVQVEGAEVSITGFGPAGPAIRGGTWRVPGDISSAAFWIVAAAASEGAVVTIRNVGLNPRRTAVLDVLRRMGARIDVLPVEGADGPEESWEPAGDLTVYGGSLCGTDIGGAEIPNLIDELPILAVAAAFAEGVTRIRDAGELRVKESDRISAVCDNLRRAGVEVEEYPDGMNVKGPARLDGGAVFESRGDHRVAMSLAVLSLLGKRPSRIDGVACVATSYPDFWADGERLGGRFEKDCYIGCARPERAGHGQEQWDG